MKQTPPTNPANVADVRAETWRAGGATMTERLRIYLEDRLNTAAERLTMDIPQDVADRMAEWAHEVNPWTLEDWLAAGGGWNLENVAPDTEDAFVKAAAGNRRRAWLARLTDAATRNAKAAALVADQDHLARVLDRLADPRKPLTREPLLLRNGRFMAFPCLPAKGETPPYRSLWPRIAYVGEPSERQRQAWTVPPVQGLDVLNGLLGLHEWGLLAGFLSDEPGERWLRVLAWAWMDERLARALETHAAKPMRPRTLKHAGREWIGAPKLVSGLSWAMGGQGKDVEVDGHRFSPAPGMGARGQLQKANMPLGYALLPADHAQRPHQAALPIDMGEDAPPLAVAVAGATQYALSPAAGFLGFYVLASSRDKALHKTTLRELTREINPGANRLRDTHHNTVALALVELANLRLFMPNGWAHAVFYIPTLPWKTLSPDEYDTPFIVGMDPALAGLLMPKEDPAVKAYRGWFLVDLTGAMKLPTLQSGLLRQYLRACATWNAYWEPKSGGKPDPQRIPAISTDRWAVLTNGLPQSAVDYLTAGKRQKHGRNRTAESIRRLLSEAEDLQDRGLVVIDKASRKEIRLLPPDIYLEAWDKAQRTGLR